MGSFAIASRERRSTGIQPPPRFARLAYSISATERLVTITGQVGTIEDWRALLMSILHDPQLQPGFAFLRDRRGSVASVEGATIIGVVDAIRRFWPHIQPSRAAILVSEASDAGAAAAHALADAHGFCVRAFKSYDDAIEWLRQGFDT